jgi:septum formation protein
VHHTGTHRAIDAGSGLQPWNAVPRLVLASASPARLRLLRSAGVEPLVVVSGVAEKDVDAPSVKGLVAVLARRKAEAVAAVPLPVAALVLGCDSLLDVDGNARGKPGTPEDAAACWRELRGRAAVLHTGHHLVDTASGESAAGVASTTVRFADPSDEEIAAYVASGEPLGVAGGFTLDGRSGPFVEGVDGDPSNVIGLSLPLLRQLLKRLGHEIVDLWRAP